MSTELDSSVFDESHGDDEIGDISHLYPILKLGLMAFSLWFFGKIMQMIKGSPLLGYIIAGAVLKNVDLIPFEDAFHAFGILGVLLLILEAGMEMNVEMMKKSGSKALFLTLFGMSVPILVGLFFMNVIFGQDLIAGFAASACLAPTSVGMATKILKEWNELETPTGQLIITVAIIDDVLSLVLLGVIKGMTGDIASDPWPIIAPLVGSLGFGIVFGAVSLRWNRVLDWCKVNIKSRKKYDYSLVIGLMSMAVTMGVCTATVTTELLGVFCAGVAYSLSPDAHVLWVTHVHKLSAWMARIFFMTIGMAIPIESMLTAKSFGFGLLFMIPAVGGKVFTGLPFARPWYEGMKVGWGRVGRGEFAFFMAQVGLDSNLFDEEVFAIIIWALLLGSFAFPFMFRWTMLVGAKAKAKAAAFVPPNEVDSASDNNEDDEIRKSYHVTTKDGEDIEINLKELMANTGEGANPEQARADFANTRGNMPGRSSGSLDAIYDRNPQRPRVLLRSSLG